MNGKNGLISIGELAHLTGSTVKALRFYDAKGYLRPSYVDSSTGYRYYSFLQVYEVDALQYCRKVGIPLERYSRFIDSGSGRIDYDSLFREGKKIAEKRIAELNEASRKMDVILRDIERSESVPYGRIERIPSHADRYYYAVPYDGPSDAFGYIRSAITITSEAVNLGMKVGLDYIVLIVCDDSGVKRYLAVDVDRHDMDGIVCLPKGMWWSTRNKESRIDDYMDYFPFCEGTRCMIYESQLFSGTFEYMNPEYELSCSILR